MRIGKQAAWILSAFVFCAGCSTTPTHVKPVGQMPIVAWGGVPQAEATVDRYRELANDGINVNFASYSNADKAKEALDNAQQAGVKLLVSLTVLHDKPEATANALKSHPALAGYFLIDEPPATQFPELADWMRKLQAADPNHYCYINLLPNYANSEQLGEPTYQAYLDKFVQTVPTSFISFDNYPILQNGNTFVVRGDWYQNLEQVAATAKKAHIPMWAFALSTHHFAYPTPTLAHLRLELFSDLAYGAQTLEYFTYWQSSDPAFANAPIDLKGHRTAIYDTVKQANTEVQGLAPVFLGSEVLDVAHTGQLPAGTHGYVPQHPIESITTSGVGMIASTIRRDNRMFLVLVNRDVNLPQTVTVQWKHKEMSGPMLRVNKDASLQRLEGNTFRETLDPGDIAVLSWTRREK
jgi:hypothetical protein